MARLKPELNYLLELTGIPTAAGREGRVIAWVERWVKARRNVRLQRDRFGNLYIRSTERKSGSIAPVFLTAHLDHPAFVVRRLTGEREVELDFRGGVHKSCFPNKPIEIFDSEETRHFGVITGYREHQPYPVITARLNRRSPPLRPGDIGRWRLRGRGAKPVISREHLYAPACDDLAGVAGALAVFDRMRRRKGFAHLGVLLTRAEEVGFVGAYAAASSGAIPPNARLICLENSRSFAESPVGAGPILRIGDRMSVFSPELTNRFTEILIAHERKNPGFRWQRRLMPGGVCEATVFAELGYQASCICLPLGNYHNMTDASLGSGAKPTGGIGPEYISIEDYFGMIDLLAVCIQKIDSAAGALKTRLEERFERQKEILQ